MIPLPKYVHCSETNPNTLALLKQYSSVSHGSENSLCYRVFSKVLAILLVSLAAALITILFSPQDSQLKICAFYIGITLAACILLTIGIYCIVNKILFSLRKPPPHPASRIEIG
ncbi:hypothetical protein [Candidatus Chlamydia corallus]|uniref:hypothetical protein n=1 Tax=Candidatus Chlamydia corallus TaxID=2038470 RepID=UPI000C2F8AEC|nr:hypothetical protein [Candidatus Chlamydia corallus]